MIIPNFTQFIKKKKFLVKNHDQYRELIFIDKQNLNFWSDEMIEIWLSKTENITASNLSQKTSKVSPADLGFTIIISSN